MYQTVHTADQPPQNMADSGIQDKLRTDLLLGVEFNQTECGTERIEPELKVVLREFNRLPHFLEHHLEPSYTPKLFELFYSV